jgi:hypothetical protein
MGGRLHHSNLRRRILPSLEGRGWGWVPPRHSAARSTIAWNTPSAFSSNFVVPHAKDRPSFLRKKGITPLVVLRFRMLAAVQLDDELRLPAGVVGDVGTDRELARELGTQARDHAPQLAFVPRGTIA